MKAGQTGGSFTVSLKPDFSVLQLKRVVPHSLTTGSHVAYITGYIAQDDHELIIFLPLSLKCLGGNRIAPYPTT